MKRVLIAVCLLLIVAEAAITVDASVSGADAHLIQWNDVAGDVTFTIPTPSTGTWELFVNEPNTKTVVGTDYGTSGTLTVAYPPGFCGVLQADASLNGVYEHGSRHQDVSGCTPPTTTTTTSTTSTTTTSTTTMAPPAPTTTTTTNPCGVNTGSASCPPGCEMGGCAPTYEPPQVAPGSAPVPPTPAPTTTTTLDTIPPAVNGVTEGNG